MPGQIITFYSYKSGVGRTMAAANVAWILASNGKRVLAIDWDLEAPGLHYYFLPFLSDSTLGSTEGLIDLILGYQSKVTTPLPPDEEDWLERCADISRFAASLEWEFPDGGTLDMVVSGRQDPIYTELVLGLDWRGLYDRMNGGAFLNLVRKRMKEHYDYILIDSRAGISDSSSICTVQMPDKLVMCTSLDGRGLEGIAKVGRSVKQQRPDIRIYPVLSRIDRAELGETERRVNAARERLAPLIDHLPPDRVKEYLHEVQFLYVPAYSYGEGLAVFDRKSVVRDAIVEPAERLTSYLSDGKVSQAVPVAEETRQAVEAWSTDRSPLEQKKAAAPKVRVFFSYSHVDKKYMDKRSLLGYLDGLERSGEVEFWWDEEIVAGDKWDEEIRGRIRETDIALILVSQWFLNSAYCQKVEIRNFLHECQRNGLIIFPIILSACDWKAHDWLRQRQLLPKEDRNIEEHYSRSGKRKALYLEIYHDLKEHISRKLAV